MDFAVSPSLSKTLESIREFVEEEIFPLEEEFLRHKSFTQIRPQLDEKRNTVRDRGWWLPQMSSKWGGMGLSLLEFGLVGEVLGQSMLGHYVFNCQAPDAGNMEILAEHGTEEQKEIFLKPLLAGEIRSCFSMTEPERPGSNPVWMDTKAQKNGDQYVINGRKWFTTGADGAKFAIVMAVTDDEAPRHQQASQIIVPTDTEGFELVRNLPVMGEEGDDYMTHGEIQYTDCKVPVKNILGREGEGFRIAQERLGPGRIHHCMRWLGICQRAFDLMCRRAVERELSPGKPLGTKQTIQNWIAESRAEIDAARLMVLRAAWKIEREGARRARVDISTIKFFVAKRLEKVLNWAIQVHGALGITDLTPIAWFYRHERGSRIYDGPDEVHKKVVARQILGSYGMTSPGKSEPGRETK